MMILGNKSSFEEAEYYYELIELETENDVLLFECVSPAVQLTTQVKCSTLYGRTVVHQNFFDLMAYYYFVVIVVFELHYYT